jgi:hypothetical protein
MWHALNSFDRGRFSGSNLLSFDPPLSDVAIDWWRDHIYAQHGLYPDDLGELLSASATGGKAITMISTRTSVRSSFASRDFRATAARHGGPNASSISAAPCSKRNVCSFRVETGRRARVAWLWRIWSIPRLGSV